MAENQCVASTWSATCLFCRPEDYFPQWRQPPLLRAEPRDACQQGAMLLPDPPLFIRRNTLSILPIYIHQPAMHTLLAMLMDELS